jgi:putative DNA primase/helicase
MMNPCTTTNAQLDAKAIDIDLYRPPLFTDEALALRFAEQHAGTLRYVAAWSKWMLWNKRHWSVDTTLHAFDLVRKTCRQASVECNKPKVASLIASAKTVSAVERLAKADRRLAATSDQWDADPWLLKTPTGTIDLRTGEQRAHNSSDYITHSTSVAPGGACPIWRRFLDRVTDGDVALQEFLQRVAGYGLTGSTREHALFFLYGTGANGKSVFLNTVAGVIGTYHRTAPIETFTVSNTDRHPTDLAGLRGARLVTAIETEEGRRWAESRIKSLTGGDKIAARFMRADFFEYVPQFKLAIAGNHKPGLRSVDEAIRRRFNLIPFTITIPPDERDDTLTDKLQEEWPGILAWMIDGCVDWQERGLSPPAVVTDATTAYLESEDAIAAWIEEQCNRDPNAWEPTSKLFAQWKSWAELAGEYVGTTRRFSQSLEARGFVPVRRTKARGFTGLRITGEADLGWSA